MLPFDEIALRLFLSALLGSAIGLERERLDWAAGLRTHMLVSVGATVFMLVSAYGFADILGHSNVVLDPSRIAAQVVSGIGFLGAGTIIFTREVVRGLTTAASLWTVAAIGLSVGGGLYVAAASATVLVLLILIGVKPIERRLFANKRPLVLRLLVNAREVSLLDIESAILQSDLHLQNIMILPQDSVGKQKIELTVQRTKNEELLPLIDKLRGLAGINEINHQTQ